MDSSLPYSESLKNTLSCFQLASADSLSGPSSFRALAAHRKFKETNHSPPTLRPPLIQIPLLIPNDTSTKRAETTLSGHIISCFIVGGEMRLCLPQILTSVLKDFSIQEINRTCAELHIYCSRCSPDQLEILKVLGILPFNTTQCGLITKSDAERLVSALGAEYHLNGKHDLQSESLKGIPVYHKCFGKGKGIFYPDLYVTPEATCIACLDCRITFSPSRFVSHSHRSGEKRTCHWGFNRDNWRYYLLVPRNMNELKYKELEKELDEIKLRFDFKAQVEVYSNSINNLKRRMKKENGKVESSHKRIKDEKDIKQEVISSPITKNWFGLSLPFQSTINSLQNIPNITHLHAAQDPAILRLMEPFIKERLNPSLKLKTATSNQESRSPDAQTDFPTDETKLKLVKNKTLSSPCHKQIFEVSTFVKNEGSQLNDNYPTPYRRASEECNRYFHGSNLLLSPVRERPATDPVSLTSGGLSNLTSDSHLQDTLHNRKITFSLNVQTPKILTTERSPRIVNKNEKTNDSLLAEVAASAMLELSTSVDERRNPCSQIPNDAVALQDESPKEDQLPDLKQNDFSSYFFDLVPISISKTHFKWNFKQSSFIISAAGTDELKLFQKHLHGVPLDKAMRILLEAVKMKFRSEEKLGVQKKDLHDISVELKRLRLSEQRYRDKAKNNKKEFHHELNQVRDFYHTQIKQANEALVSLGKKFADVRIRPDHREKVDVLQHKILDRLHKQIDDKEEAIRELERQLLEERDQRLIAENSLKEAEPKDDEKTNDFLNYTSPSNGHTNVLESVNRFSIPITDKPVPSSGSDDVTASEKSGVSSFVLRSKIKATNDNTPLSSEHSRT